MIDFIEKNKEALISDLSTLVSIPSVSGAPDGIFPYGKDVADAFKHIEKTAERLGLDSDCLGYVCRAFFGEGEKTFAVVTHTDVVSAGGGWTLPAYALTRKDGRLYGRGVLDDKGATIAALYAVAAVKAAGLKPKMKIMLLVGGEEECGMGDMSRYVNEVALPDYALTPDAGFPITNAELGCIFGALSFDRITENGRINILSINGGRASNCVAETCECVLSCDGDVADYIEKNSDSLLEPTVKYINGTLTIACHGISAHGSVPWNGRNAILDMLSLLERTYKHFGTENSFLRFTEKYIKGTKGEALGLACSDELSGPLSVNFGMLDYKNGTARLTVDSRVPISVRTADIREKLLCIAAENGVVFTLSNEHDGICIPKDSDFMRSVASSYEKITGEECGFICERGSTYAKAFKGHCVAFGPALENNGCCGNMHAPDEYITEDALILAAKIYAQTIADFCC